MDISVTQSKAFGHQLRLAWGLKELSVVTDVSVGFLRGQIRCGALRARKISGRLLILDEDVRAWLGQGRPTEEKSGDD